MNRQDQGFTLIELLIIVAIIGILSAMATTSFSLYKSSAAYAVIGHTIHSAMTAANAGVVDESNPPPAVPFTVEEQHGPVVDVNARAYLPGMQIPDNTKVTIEYDPTCNLASCSRELIQVRHCFGNEYARWERFGDETEIILERIPGAGCP